MCYVMLSLLCVMLCYHCYVLCYVIIVMCYVMLSLLCVMLCLMISVNFLKLGLLIVCDLNLNKLVLFLKNEFY